MGGGCVLVQQGTGFESVLFLKNTGLKDDSTSAPVLSNGVSLSVREMIVWKKYR